MDQENHALAPRRILALDVGKKRIGLAITGLAGATVVGLPTFERTRIREDLLRLKAIAGERCVQDLLIGRPLHMSGDESRQSAYTLEFGERLAKFLDLPVIFWDERLTSKEATRLMRDHGATLEQRKKSVDQMSAILLLENYLEFQAFQLHA